MLPTSVSLSAHPVAELLVLAARLPGPLQRLETPGEVRRVLQAADAPTGVDAETKTAVRDLLRAGGFKPAGRNKPASEYLVAARAQGRLSGINALVDVLNAVSLETGLPLSVVDAERTSGPLFLGVAANGSDYVFNRSGQVLDLSGLLCLFDECGPCANAVKDSQRTKTHDETQAVVVVVWGTKVLPGRTAEAGARMRQMLEDLDAEVFAVEIQPD